MAQIINRHSTLGGELGHAYGQGLATSIENILQNKVREMEGQKFTDAAGQAGFPKEAANFLQYLSPQERLAFFQRLQPGDFGQQGQQQSSPLAQLLQSPQISQQQAQPLQKINPMISPQQQLLQDVAALQQGRQQQPQQQQIASQNAEQPVSTQQSPTGNPTRKLLDILSRPSPSQQAQERHHQEKLAKEDEKQQNKYILPKIEKQVALAREKREQDNILKRIIAGRESGNVRNALLSQALKVAGIDYEGLKNKETLEQTKLTNYFLKGASSMFGGRVSNFQAQTILGSVPNILQDDDGAKWLANQMINSNKEDQARARVMRDVLKDNPRIKPLEFDSEVERRMEPLEQQFADDFINGATAFTTKTGSTNKFDEEYESLPAASGFNESDRIFDDSSGHWLKPEGNKWVKVKK